ncbi:MAG: ATP-binding cassette domain-containing protein [Fidelibacterota bacterium]|nr:MAG: ATP-binding cassette domain-containing protein [Candidatus Neomarinimicrobiota bacterium]
MQQPIYQIKNLNLHLKKKSVLSITNFEIHRGITYAIIGQPGSGKTSLLEMLAGQCRPTSGTILYEGDSITNKKVHRKYQEEICYLPQLPSSGRRVSGTVQRYMLKHIRTAPWSTDSAADRLKTVSKRMGLGDKLARTVKTLSPGERRWINLAICIASDAKVLIIDELEQHMSYDGLDLVKRQVQRKCSYEGTTVLVSTLNPTTIRRLPGVSVTLDRGRIAMIRSVREGSRGRRSPGSAGNNPRSTRRNSEKANKTKSSRR